jgi:phosphomevalonate kinase
MLIACAPGKIVLSGAYAVLEGAPAIVTAVDRYVIADASRAAPRLTPEVAAAFAGDAAPWFDARELFEGDDKLGLGSSAAILIASLGAAQIAKSGWLDDAELCARVFEHGLRAHRAAQGGGSGIDVAASAFGGTLIARHHGEKLGVRALALPPELQLTVWFSGVPASTAALLKQVQRLRACDEQLYRRAIAAQIAGSERALYAAERADASALVAALALQETALAELGVAAGASIVTAEVAELAELARREQAALLPAGAGGGDIAVFAGTKPPSLALTQRAEALGHRRLSLGFAARGVHAVDCSENGMIARGRAR